MLTSKDVLERTGISRATLNNYIATGLLPRPEVLPPNPQDGAAPRIGYFPDGTVERVLEIQRLKREGWSIARIASHFAGGAAPAPASPLPPPPRSPLSTPAPSPAPADRAPLVSLADIRSPAFLLDDAFGPVWMNDAARFDGSSPLHGIGPRPSGADLLARLLAWQDDPSVVHFVAGLARQRGTPLSQLAPLVPAGVRSALESAYGASPSAGAEPVAQVLLAGPPESAQVLQAIHFREGVLFVAGPGPVASAVARPPARREFPAPALLPLAVLATTLQDAHALWLRLPAREYFELVSEVWSELDAIFRELGGRHARHPGEGMVCYFLQRPGADYLVQALQAADRIRAALRGVSSRWQARKGWDLELRMNTGLDAGQEWTGPLRLVEPVELSVLGATADHAGELSRAGRDGSVWITRGFVDRVPAADRERLRYGVPRRSADGAPARVLASFARLQDLAAGTGAIPPAMADLPVTELLELAPAGPTPSTGPAAR
ncbi:hypothetical protein [Ramlibacter algicola]|uniref:Uncharacterized protein n=1 Tax=Ramlibacter algicola TaxID=2795217 RepID=A0A934Q1L8_9BURK|nr:hypothetical protein [Ramlibacter algicola]MBK0393435.1 hypothetical protein [Ramlibacter algicola]